MGAGQQITAPEGDSQPCQELALWPGNVAEQAPGNARGRIRTMNAAACMFISVLDSVCCFVKLNCQNREGSYLKCSNLQSI